MLWLIGVGAFWIAWSVINALIAQEKNRDAGAILAFSLVLSPLLVCIYICAVGPREPLYYGPKEPLEKGRYEYDSGFQAWRKRMGRYRESGDSNDDKLDP